MYYLSYFLRQQRTLGVMRKQEMFSLRYNANCSAIVPRKKMIRSNVANSNYSVL